MKSFWKQFLTSGKNWLTERNPVSFTILSRFGNTKTIRTTQMDLPAPVVIKNKHHQIVDLGRFLQVWNRDAYAVTVEPSGRASKPKEGRSYDLFITDLMQSVTRDVSVIVPASLADSFRVGYNEEKKQYYLICQDLMFRQQMDALNTMIGEAMQEKCASRGMEPNVILSDFFRWPWSKKTPNELMDELKSLTAVAVEAHRPPPQLVLKLNGGYHNFKRDPSTGQVKNDVTIEWVLSLFLHAPPVPRIIAGKRKAVTVESAPEEEES